MFRCGNMSLHIETGRFARLKIHFGQGTCFHFNDSLEQELHFFIDCVFHDDTRRKLFQKGNLC